MIDFRVLRDTVLMMSGLVIFMVEIFVGSLSPVLLMLAGSTVVLPFLFPSPPKKVAWCDPLLTEPVRLLSPAEKAYAQARQIYESTGDLSALYDMTYAMDPAWKAPPVKVPSRRRTKPLPQRAPDFTVSASEGRKRFRSSYDLGPG